MSIMPSVPVLTGDGDSLLRLEDTELYLNLAHEDHRIPSAAIASVHAEHRAVAVVLTAPAGTEAAVHRIENVGQAAAVTFADTVNALLPGVAGRDLTADGTALVSSKHYPVDVEKIRHKRKLVVGTVAVAVVGLAITALLVLSGYGWFAVLYAPIGMVGTMLVARVHILLPGVVRLWRLPKHGITVHAVYSHVDGEQRAVYTYTDANGDERVFMTGILLPRMGVERIAVSYDARNPRHVVRAVDNGRGFETLGLVATAVFALFFLVAGIGASLATAFL